MIAFRRLKTEWRAENFGFPLIGDFIERMTPQYTDGTPQPIEYKQPQLAAAVSTPDMTPEEAKSWWQGVKAVVARIGATKRVEENKPAIQNEPIREMTDAEYEARRDLLKQQAAEAERRFGK